MKSRSSCFTHTNAKQCNVFLIPSSRDTFSHPDAFVRSTVAFVIGDPEELVGVVETAVTGVHKAVVDGDMELVEELLVSGRVCPDERGPGDMTPLHYAVQYDREDIVRLLFRHSADPDLRNSSGLSALHMASALPASDMVWLLLDWGADPSILEKRMMTPKQYNTANDANVERLLTAAEGTNTFTEVAFSIASLSEACALLGSSQYLLYRIEQYQPPMSRRKNERPTMHQIVNAKHNGILVSVFRI